MSRLVRDNFDVMVLLSAKIIYDCKIEYSNWSCVIDFVKQHIRCKVENIDFIKKRIEEQLVLIDGGFFKKYTNQFKSDLACNKCFYKVVDWILQLHQQQPRLARAVNKKRVAKNILIEEMLEAKKHFINQALVNKINLDTIIDISIKSYIKE